MISRKALLAMIVIASAAEAQQRDSVQLPLPGPGILSGFIADSMESPLDGAEVTIQSLRLNVLTGPDGSFRFENIKPGRYQISARKIGFYPSGRFVTVGENGGATALFLTRRQNFSLPPVVTAARRGGLSGVVGDTAYNAIASAEVSVLASDKRAQSDSTGAFFLDLKPGRYMVRVEREGFGSEMLSVTIPRDSGRRVMVWLAPPSRGWSAAREAHFIDMFSRRLARRNVVWSKIYTREDITKSGMDLLTQLATAGAGHPVEWDCMAIIDGDTTRQIPLWAIDNADLETVEIYSSAKSPRSTVQRIGTGNSMPARGGGRPRCATVWAWFRK